jgi:hypothetical protein
MRTKACAECLLPRSAIDYNHSDWVKPIGATCAECLGAKCEDCNLIKESQEFAEGTDFTGSKAFIS